PHLPPDVFKTTKTLNIKMTQEKFYFSTESQPHTQRTKEIMERHPEVNKLIGRNPFTFFILIFLVGFQMTLAAIFGKMGFEYWWLSLLTAWFVGAFTTNPLYVVVHEGTHNLIFKNRVLNRLSTLLADLPNVVPGAVGFTTFHLKHHAYMGDDQLDADLPSELEARLVGNSWWRKTLWLLGFPLWQIYRTFRLTRINTWNSWMYLNIAVVFLSDALMVYFFGWHSLFYLFFSMLFALGLHPVGARWIQEHYTLDEHQETYSYYGRLNTVCLNIGYHNEHHDFPSIPWNRLPKLRRLAPEYYDNLKSHQSWTKLLLAFIFNPEYTLFRRVKR
ncbi:MAG: fatty acid desaturase, partial [Bacteroidota bacterium]